MFPIQLLPRAKEVSLECRRTALCYQSAFVGVAVKPVGKPDALVGHVRFDERGRETTGCLSAPV